MELSAVIIAIIITIVCVKTYYDDQEYLQKRWENERRDAEALWKAKERFRNRDN